MFGKLKAAVADNAAEKGVLLLEPHIAPIMEEIKKLSPESISHDESYLNKIISPAKLTILAASSGMTKLIPQFDEKFTHCMFHLRDQLVDLSGEKIDLIPDFKDRLPQVLKEGLKLA